MNSNVLHQDIIDAPEFRQQGLSGRATWDDRGNSVWEWQTAPGVFTREISSQQLQALEAVGLHLVDSAPGHIAVYTAWKRDYSAASVNELVMPARRKQIKAGGFDRFLKRLGLPT